MTVEIRDEDAYFRFSFSARVGVLDYGEFKYTVLSAPAALVAALPWPAGGRRRIRGEFEGWPVSLAFNPSRDAAPYLILSARLLKDAGVAIGDEVTVRFNVDDPDAVDVPEALEHALGRDAKARAAWSKLTPGKRRGLCARVRTGKQAATQARTAARIVEELRGERAAPTTRRSPPSPRRRR